MLVIGGPCVLESDDVNMRIADCLAEACSDLGLPFVFKASFDKANRSSATSHRGPGLEKGLEQLAAIGEAVGTSTCTDVHDPSQARTVAEYVSLLQVPAFLSRQTDLLTAVAETGRAINVKKGQFMAPMDMANVIAKVNASGGSRLMLTERGTFFGYNRLVNDFVGLGDLMELCQDHGCPVCFDVTHSTQLPAAEGTSTGGRPDRAPLLLAAAAAVGIDAIFLECHPEPETGLSDASTMLPLSIVPGLLRQALRIRKAITVD
jgi:2-dehydro-3-deoxyphosphooctonate aldolase (KDO 8-P synthase)